MNKNNFVLFAFFCAVLGCFYLFMHYQVKSAEQIIAQATITAPVESNVLKKEPVKKPVKKVKPKPQFVEPIQVDDGFDILPEEADTIVID